jgi:DNA-binding winged helix-turn-helix (wHTH) protein/TolB-like protein/Tfp pilus assembly protein PilF
MSTLTRRFYQFGPFRIDAEKRVLMREGEVEPLAPKAFDMLLVLVRHHGEVLEKVALMEMLWPDSDVEEANLPQNISALRKALGESPNERRYIITVPGRGYRFAADVEELEDEGQDVIVERYAKSIILIQEHEASQGDANRALRLPHFFSGRLKPILAGVTILAFIILLASGLWIWLSRKPAGQLPEIPIKSLAVLPFRHLGVEGDEYIGLGIADSLITRLSNLRQIKVRPTSSILKYSNQLKDPGQIGRELGVEAVLEGSIRRDGESVRVTVQLVRVEDGSPLWAEKFDDRFTSIFKIEDSMSGRVAESLVPKLTGEERAALAKRYTDNTEAYNEYLKGRLFWNKRTVDGMKKAIEQYEQAIAHDPNYALAHAGLADCYLMLYSYSDSSNKEDIQRAKAAATKAMQIDTALGEAHTSLGFVLFTERDNSGAEREYKQAIELNPNYATAYHRYANLLLSTGRPDEALQMIKRAQELDPLSLIINTALGGVYTANRRYDEAVEQLRKTLEMDPTFIHARAYLGMAYLKKGMYEDAIKEIEKATVLSDNSVPPQVVSYRGYIYAVWGKRAEAKKILRDLIELRRRRHVSAPHIALIYAGLGETDQAFAWLETAYKEKELGFGWLNDPGFDSLRSDPRFAELARRISLAF